MISSEIKSFADDSSIYGLRYLSISQRPWERTFWFIFMIISVVLSGLVVYTSLTDWKNDPLYTVIDTISYPVQKVPFPAVTVCPPGVDRNAFIEKVLNHVKFQCYKSYEFSESDCMESKVARKSFRFLFKKIHQMALDATLSNITSKTEAELKHELLHYIAFCKGIKNSVGVDIFDSLFSQLLSYGSSAHSSLKRTKEKLTNFILDAMGRLSRKKEYLTELESSIMDEETNNTLTVNMTIADLMECLNTDRCGNWIKLGLAYISLFELYGDYTVWDLGSIVVYFSHIIEIDVVGWPSKPSELEILLDARFQEIFQSLSASSSNLSAYDIIALLGFDSNAMKPDFLPNFPELKSIWNETNVRILYTQDGKMDVKKGCYISSYEMKWKDYMERPEKGNVPCEDTIMSQKEGFEPCCRIKKLLGQNMYDIIQMSKYTQYPPHRVDLNERDPYDLSKRPDVLQKMILKYPLYDYNESEISYMTDSDREIVEPLIPFCAFDSEWETIPYGGGRKWVDGRPQLVTAYRHYCKSFSPSFTDKGICYSWNGMEPSKMFSESDYMQQTNEIFQYKTNETRGRVYPKANGPDNGFRFIIDTHTFSSSYKKGSNTNKKVEIALHEGSEIPYFKAHGFKVTAGMETDITVSMSDLHSTDEVKEIEMRTRKCRFRNEPIFSGGMPFMNVYSQTGCVLQCHLEIASKLCGCIPWYHPKLPNVPYGLCDSFGNKCFYETMNLNGNATISCSQCEYDCNKTTYTTSFVIRPIDPETFCTDEVNYPIVDIKKYIDLRPLFKNNPKLFYLEWKALIDGKKYRYSNEEHCKWKAKNDFAIVNIHLSTPTIPRMKQDVKHKLYDKLSILGGVLSLICGVSMLSFFEILAYVIRNGLNFLFWMKRHSCPGGSTD